MIQWKTFVITALSMSAFNLNAQEKSKECADEIISYAMYGANSNLKIANMSDLDGVIFSERPKVGNEDIKTELTAIKFEKVGTIPCITPLCDYNLTPLGGTVPTSVETVAHVTFISADPYHADENKHVVAVLESNTGMSEVYLANAETGKNEKTLIYNTKGKYFTNKIKKVKQADSCKKPD